MNMEHTQSAVCVGGPFAGRVIALPRDCRVLQFPSWPSPANILHSTRETREDALRYDVHTYRWFVNEIRGSGISIATTAMVHESMTNHEARRCVLGMVLAQIIMDIPDRDKPAKAEETKP